MQYSEKSLKITVNNLTINYVDEGSIHPQTTPFIHGCPLNKKM
jgi:hypothetical protein